MATNTILARILQKLEPADTAPNWSQKIGVGFSRDVFSDLATELGVSEKKLSDLVAHPAPKKKDVVLTATLSEAIYRLSFAVSSMQAQAQWGVSECLRWLNAPNAALRQRVPAQLIQTGIGFEYVTTAISRI